MSTNPVKCCYQQRTLVGKRKRPGRGVDVVDKHAAVRCDCDPTAPTPRREERNTIVRSFMLLPVVDERSASYPRGAGPASRSEQLVIESSTTRSRNAMLMRPPYHHLISWTSTTFVLSPCHPRSPDAETKKRFVGSTTGGGRCQRRALAGQGGTTNREPRRCRRGGRQ
jgi:hypothetical protein